MELSKYRNGCVSKLPISWPIYINWNEKHFLLNIFVWCACYPRSFDMFDVAFNCFVLFLFLSTFVARVSRQKYVNEITVFKWNWKRRKWKWNRKRSNENSRYSTIFLFPLEWSRNGFHILRALCSFFFFFIFFYWFFGFIQHLQINKYYLCTYLYIICFFLSFSFSFPTFFFPFRWSIFPGC